MDNFLFRHSSKEKMAKTMLRAYNNNSDRLSTAVLLSDGKVLQVYPSKAHFESEEAWEAEWHAYANGILAVHFETEVVNGGGEERMKNKMKAIRDKWQGRHLMEFFDEEYDDMFKSVIVEKKSFGPQITVVMMDNTVWTVVLPQDFIRPPFITKEGGAITKYDNQYSPALSSVRWLLMLAFIPPDN